MKQSKPIKSVYIQSPSNKSNRNLVHSHIQKTNSFILTPSNKQKSINKKPTQKIHIEQSYISLNDNNDVCAISSLPLQTKSINSAFKAYFSKIYIHNKDEQKDNKDNNIGLSMVSKIINPYALERQQKSKSQIFRVLEKLYHYKIRIGFNLVKKPYTYISTIKKLPTFARQISLDQSNKQDINKQDINKTFKKYLVGKIAKQNIAQLRSNKDSRYGKISTTMKPITSNEASDIKKLDDHQKNYFKHNQAPSSSTPLINKLIIAEELQLIQTVIQYRHEQNQRNNPYLVKSCYPKTFSIMNQNTEYKQKL